MSGAYRCEGCGASVDLARTPLESGLLRVAVLGVGGLSLRFDEPALHAAAAPLLGPCPHTADPAWDEQAWRERAAPGWDALVAAAGDARLQNLAALWRPRALRLLQRRDELTREDVLRARLAERLEALTVRIGEARAAGDDDEAQRLHARYIELGMVLAGRMAAAWA